MYTHIKNKHDLSTFGSGRGRGRPKKDIGETIHNRSQFNPLTMEYFKSQEKVGEVNKENVISLCEEMFKELFIDNYKEYKDKLIKEWTEPKDYPLFKNLHMIMKTNKINDIDNIKCDEVFAEYLFKVSQVTCDDYFKNKVVKFVILYREFLNAHKRKELDLSDDYSVTYQAEDAPDVSNEFITEFLMDGEESIFEYDKEESIELTQNFCQWMYDSNYTSSKLTLISS